MYQTPPAPDTLKILVVGTTPDYVEWICHSRPGQALFLTRPDLRHGATQPPPAASDEILCPMETFEQAQTAVRQHLEKWGQSLSGITCFDCESMMTAAFLADRFRLTYPDAAAVSNSRDKFQSRQLWQRHAVPCPRTLPAAGLEDILAFYDTHTDGIVLKPLAGSGSELVFLCRSKTECITAFSTIRNGLETRSANGLFSHPATKNFLMLAEEYIEGPEYSCDFFVEETDARIIRMTQKIKPGNRPFGTAAGYILPADLPKGTDRQALPRILFKAARALGIRQGICMVDFIVQDRQPVIIEMTPRPGGDCIPFLLRESAGLDILGLTLDAARQLSPDLLDDLEFKPRIGVRIHAQKNGILKKIDASRLEKDRRVKQIHITRQPGHVIALPPADYDSWLLGHIIVEPSTGPSPETQALLISKQLEIVMEDIGT